MKKSAKFTLEYDQRHYYQLLVISLWHSFVYEEISEWNVNKSANRFDIHAPKVEWLPPSFLAICWCEDQIYALHLIDLLLSSVADP
jgi:hypothetical protein